MDTLAVASCPFTMRSTIIREVHYSDFWADPGKQTAPKSMASMTTDEKAEAIEQFTKDSLNSLIDSGVNVGMVQIGNETNNGVAGEKSWAGMAKVFSCLLVFIIICTFAFSKQHTEYEEKNPVSHLCPAGCLHGDGWMQEENRPG